MPYRRTPALRIPKLLAVSVLGIAPGCGDDDSSDTSNDTVADATGTGDPALPNCQATPDEAACGDVMSCVYFEEYGGCVIDCAIIEDATTCNGQPNCEWFEGECVFGPIA